MIADVAKSSRGPGDPRFQIILPMHELNDPIFNLPAKEFMKRLEEGKLNAGMLNRRPATGSMASYPPQNPWHPGNPTQHNPNRVSYHQPFYPDPNRALGSSQHEMFSHQQPPRRERFTPQYPSKMSEPTPFISSQPVPFLQQQRPFSPGDLFPRQQSSSVPQGMYEPPPPHRNQSLQNRFYEPPSQMFQPQRDLPPPQYDHAGNVQNNESRTDRDVCYQRKRPGRGYHGFPTRQYNNRRKTRPYVKYSKKY